jgi:hypothetical protein
MHSDLHFKDSISIVEQLHVAARLAAAHASGASGGAAEPYLDSAKQIWNWVFAFDGGRGH